MRVPARLTHEVLNPSRERIHLMRNLSRFLVAAAVVALAAPAMASAAQTGTAKTGTRGTVVQRDARAGAVVLATRSGDLQRVKLAKPNRLAMGAVVQVRGSKVSVVGRSRKAKVHGVVVRRNRHSYALAGNGSVLAINTATPPPAGQQITATVQVTPTELSDDDGDVEVDDHEAASAKVRGTVLSQDASTLRLSVAGFPSGLAIALGGKTIPTLAVGTAVKARVALGPDPANANGVVLTLVRLKVENGEHGDHRGSCVKAEGEVTALVEAGAAGGAPGLITIADEDGSVTFVIPAGFGPTDAAVGDEVEAKGTAATTPGGQPTLVKLEGADGEHANHDDGDSDESGAGDGSGGDD
jgi:hypothetical protein